MRIVHGDELPEVPAIRHRAGGLTARILLEGEPGTPGNFQLSLAVTSREFTSPRHRHNFEQYRCVLEGRSGFGRDGTLAAGQVGYFPEGVSYGPQENEDRTLTAVLQFGGASGSGYLAVDEVEGGMEALKEEGDFSGGVFRRREDRPGRRNQDAFEAIWEHVNGRRMTYPASPYAAPRMMDPSGGEWEALAPGAGRLRLGTFAENDTEAAFLRLRGGRLRLEGGPGVYLVTEGEGVVEGQPVRRLSAFHLAPGEAAEASSDTGMMLLHLRLPRLGTAGARTAA